MIKVVSVKIKIFLFAGLILAGLTVFADASTCVHDHYGVDHVSALSHSVDLQASDDHECHHSSQSSHQSVVAWVRSTHEHNVAHLSPSKFPASLIGLGKVRTYDVSSLGLSSRWKSSERLIYSGFQDTRARTGRIII